jgi:hypothetical protein
MKSKFNKFFTTVKIKPDSSNFSKMNYCSKDFKIGRKG